MIDHADLLTLEDRALALHQRLLAEAASEEVRCAISIKRLKQEIARLEPSLRQRLAQRLSRWS